eukprot:jgi/Mesvir1/21852/Mv04233-RA.1
MQRFVVGAEKLYENDDEVDEAVEGLPSLYWPGSHVGGKQGAAEEDEEGVEWGRGGPRVLSILEVEPDAKHVVELVREGVESGLVNTVMLRDAGLRTAVMLKTAQTLRTLCQSLGTRFIVDSRLDVAALSGADGLQLSSSLSSTPMTASKAREFMRSMNLASAPGGPSPSTTPHPMIGISVTSLEGALLAQRQSPDYIVLSAPLAAEGSALYQDPVRFFKAVRRNVLCQLIASSSLCELIGGPQKALSLGADGILLPADVLDRELLRLLSAKKVVVEQAVPVPTGDRLWGAIALIAGGTVGAGIIALPVKTAAAGFFPSAAALMATWAYMTVTALLLVELSVWFGPHASLSTMARLTLGKLGKNIMQPLYVFIYLATLTAYVSESAGFLASFGSRLGLTMAPWAWALTSTVLHSGVIYAGSEPVDVANRYCLIGAVVSYVALVYLCGQAIDPSLLMRTNWRHTLSPLPVMVVAFTFHNMVPSLIAYLGSAQQVAIAVVVGTFIPLLMYLTWQLIIMGTVPYDPAMKTAAQILGALGDSLGTHGLLLVQVFAFLAIVTSFLGVGMGCMHFVADIIRGLNIRKVKNLPDAQRRLVPLVATFLPPLLVGVTCPGVFVSALEFSGTFRMVMFGILPAIMVWSGRYVRGKKPWLPGGRLLLSLVVALAVCVISVEWSKKLGGIIIAQAAA